MEGSEKLVERWGEADVVPGTAKARVSASMGRVVAIVANGKDRHGEAMRSA